MKKIHQAIQRGNRWIRKTKWQLDAEDYIGALIFILVLGFVGIRVLVG